MSTYYVFRLALGGLAAVAVLSGCSANSGGFGMPTAAMWRDAASKSKTFKYTGAEQSFKVPAGVTSIEVDAFGAAGAGLKHSSSKVGAPAYGGRVEATISVKPDQTLRIFVGGGGLTGGFNGGGDGAYRGGGATDVRENGNALSDRILVAGGGGGIGPMVEGGGHAGGGGGGKRGGNGRGVYTTDDSGKPGRGGTQHKGGAGGASGSKEAGAGDSGTLGLGGNGGKGHSTTSYFAESGGGGYYGGGGGGGGAPLGNGGAGGGGSGYVEPSATNAHMWRNWKNASGNGIVVITW
jgi:hypothetical protein